MENAFCSEHYEYSNGADTGIMSKFCFRNLNIYRFFPYKNEEQKVGAISFAEETLSVLNGEFIGGDEACDDILQDAIYKSTKIPSVRSVYLNGFLIGFKSMIPLKIKYNKDTHFLIKDYPSLKETWENAVRLSLKLRGYFDKDIPSISVKYYTQIETSTH
jgi:hypothetical protein